MKDAETSSCLMTFIIPYHCLQDTLIKPHSYFYSQILLRTYPTKELIQLFGLGSFTVRQHVHPSRPVELWLSCNIDISGCDHCDAYFFYWCRSACSQCEVMN